MGNFAVADPAAAVAKFSISTVPMSIGNFVTNTTFGLLLLHLTTATIHFYLILVLLCTSE